MCGLWLRRGDVLALRLFAGHAKDELKPLARAALRRERAAIVERAHMLAALLPGLMYRLSLHGPASGRAPQAADEPEAAPTHELPALGTEQPPPRAPGRLSLAILFVTVASVVAVVADWRSPVRSVLALGFLLFAPGLALTEMLAIREPFERLALIAAGSLALETVVAVPLLY